MSSRESVGEWVVVYLKGLFMGAADAVPGVSGGTIAFITGIYERLITAITALDPGVLRYLPRLSDSAARADLSAELSEMDIAFLLVLGMGIVTALVSVARLMTFALDEFRALTFAFFFGLIAASAIVLYSHIALDTPGRIAAGGGGFLLAFFLADPSLSNALPHSLPMVFVAGAIAIVAMILPGISGAFILLLLGQYEYLSATLTRFTDAIAGLARGGSVEAVVEPAAVVATFGIGAVIGLLTVAHAIRWALEHYREATLTFLVSLMVGALRLPVVEVLDATPAATPASFMPAVVIAVGGGALVLVLDRYTEDLEFA